MSVSQELRGLLELRFFKLLSFSAFLTWAGGSALSLKYCVLDLDLYWHLAVGNWILEHHAVPHTGIFSYTASNRPWIAYSWGYEVLLSLAYRWFGLVGVGSFGVLMTLMVAVGVYWMTQRLCGRFWLALALAATASWSFLFSLMPRPVFFSMLLFMVTLTLILEAQRSGSGRTLYWLAPIFGLWANLHIQFVYGLFLLGLLLAVNVAQRVAGSLGMAPDFLSSPTLPLRQLAGVFAVCLLASCLGPYSFHLYQVIFQYSRAKIAYSTIQELQPLNFRFIEHYTQLLLAAGGFFAMGWQKKSDLFKLSLLTIASVVAFRTMRDSWFLCICAAACIAACSAGESPVKRDRRDRTRVACDAAGVTAVVLAVLLLIARNTDFNMRGLNEAMSSQFPIAAANFLRENPLSGPLYNSLDWGGFLIWYLPDYPVAIDGRNDLYGDDLDRRFYTMERGMESPGADPYLHQAGVILLRANLPLTNLLRSDPSFQIVYQDQMATVFVRR